MHYYQFHIGDYRSATAHLTNEEDLAYRRLLDWYYDNETPISLADTDRISRRLRVDVVVMERVLLDMFCIDVDGNYRNTRADVELANYQERLKQASNAGKASAKRRLNARSTPVQQPSNDSTADVQLTNNHEPETINHKPSKERTATRGARLPIDWKPNAELVAWSKTERPDLDLRKVFEEFKDYWSSVPGSKGVKLDWDATWRNWVRKQTAAKASFAQQASDAVRSTVPYSQDKALRKVEEDHKTGAPPPAHIREMMRGILGVKNA